MQQNKITDNQDSLPTKPEELREKGLELIKSENLTYKDEDLALECFEKAISGKLSENKVCSCYEESVKILLNRTPKSKENFDRAIEMLKKACSLKEGYEWSKCAYYLDLLTSHPELKGFSSELKPSDINVSSYRKKAVKYLCPEGIAQIALKWTEEVLVGLKTHHDDLDVEILEYYIEEAIVSLKKYRDKDVKVSMHTLRGIVHQYYKSKNKANYDAAIEAYEYAIGKDKYDNGNKQPHGKSLALFHLSDLVSQPQAYGFPSSYYDEEVARKFQGAKKGYMAMGGIQALRNEIQRYIGAKGAGTEWMSFKLGAIVDTNNTNVTKALELAEEAIRIRGEFTEKSFIYTIKGWIYENLMPKTTASLKAAWENYTIAIVTYSDNISGNDENFGALQRAFESLLLLAISPIFSGFSRVDEDSKKFQKFVDTIPDFLKEADKFHLDENLKRALIFFTNLNKIKLKSYDSCLVKRERDLIKACIYNKNSNDIEPKKRDLLAIRKSLSELQNEFGPKNKAHDYYLGFSEFFRRSYLAAEDICLGKLKIIENDQNLPEIGNRLVSCLPLFGEEALDKTVEQLAPFFRNEIRIRRRAKNLWNFFSGVDSMECIVQEAAISRTKSKSEEISLVESDQQTGEWQTKFFDFQVLVNSAIDHDLTGKSKEYIFGVKDAVAIMSRVICKGIAFTEMPPAYYLAEEKISVVAQDPSNENEKSISFVERIDRSNSILKMLRTRSQTRDLHKDSYRPDTELEKTPKPIKKACCQIF